MPPMKTIVKWIVVIFLLYAILTNPTEAANMVKSAFDILVGGVQNIATFVDSLIS